AQSSSRCVSQVGVCTSTGPSPVTEYAMRTPSRERQKRMEGGMDEGYQGRLGSVSQGGVMHIRWWALGVAAVSMVGRTSPAAAQERGDGQAANKQDEVVRTLLGRLDLEKYKATIKGLTQFGDRRQGTERNRKAVDWIEAQLQSYGCPTERVKYVYDAPERPAAAARRQDEPFKPVIASGEVRLGPGGSRYRGIQRQTGVNTDPSAQPD